MATRIVEPAAGGIKIFAWVFDPGPFCQGLTAVSAFLLRELGLRSSGLGREHEGIIYIWRRVSATVN